MKHMTIYLTFFIIMTAGIVFAGQDNTATLIIHVTGFENSNGTARIALVNSKENYSADTPFKGINGEIINGEVKKTITLPFGEYAIKVYHDENGNKELDTRIFGIPKERYGFSNNARGTMGPPEYEKAVFSLNSSKKEIFIIVK